MNNAQMREVCRDICGVLNVPSHQWNMISGFTDDHVNLLIYSDWGTGLTKQQLDKLSNYFGKYFAGVQFADSIIIVLNRPQ